MPTRYTSASVRQNLARRVSAMEECERTPHAYAKIQDKVEFQRDKEATKKTLETATPPDTTAEQRVKIKRKIALLEHAIREGKEGVVPPMPSHYQMEKVPAGTVGQLTAHDQFWKTHTLDDDGRVVTVNNKGKNAQRGGLFELKDLYRVLRKDEEGMDPDIANLERIRPSGHTAPLADMRLPKTFALSPQAKENFDEVFSNVQPAFEDPTAKVQRLPKRKRTPRAPAPDESRCQAVSKKGTRCPNAVVPGCIYCFSAAHKLQLGEKPVTEA